ncbi:MAG: aminopeptidase [Bacteroidetes bacterium]|nr:MAG: aminopeptidase [Bacteroidota bacterium]
MKRTFLVIFILFLAYLLANYDLVWYGIKQGIGQGEILYYSKPLSDFLENPNYPDSLKQKIRLIQEIKQFAEDSLGINPSNNYIKMYDQQGKPILWVLTACDPYTLNAKEWQFSFLGSFSYKGFFDLEKAKAEQKILDSEGYDTDLEEVNAWSTLGFFNDPILSNFLRRKTGKLANLIIHELTHGTLYVKDSVNYNENLANFVGHEGAKRFLIHKFGKNSEQYQNYMYQNVDQEKFVQFILKSALQLDSLYKSSEKLDISQKKVKKDQKIKEIVANFDTISFQSKSYQGYFDDYLPNNTFFMGFRRYNAKQNLFETQFEKEFQGNFKKYFEYLKKAYPSL